MQQYFNKALPLMALSLIGLISTACHPQPYTQSIPMAYQKMPQELAFLHSQGIEALNLGQTIRLTFPDYRFFQGSTATLNPNKTYALEQVAAFITHFPQAKVTITGYNDKTLSTKEAKAFSLANAQAIAGFLWNDGLPSTHMVIQGKGYVNPLNSQNTPQAGTENRRVEMFIAPA